MGHDQLDPPVKGPSDNEWFFGSGADQELLLWYYSGLFHISLPRWGLSQMLDVWVL